MLTATFNQQKVPKDISGFHYEKIVVRANKTLTLKGMLIRRQILLLIDYSCEELQGDMLASKKMSCNFGMIFFLIWHMYVWCFSHDEAEKRLPKNCLVILSKYEPVLKWTKDCDNLLYQGLVEVLIPEVLRPIPSKLIVHSSCFQPIMGYDKPRATSGEWRDFSSWKGSSWNCCFLSSWA